MLQQLETAIPPNLPFIFWIDAGSLGTYQNAIYLHNQKRQFAISCKSTTYSDLFQYLHLDLEQWKWKSIRNDKMIAISWKVRQNSNKAPKIVNWLTNLEISIVEEEATFRDRKLQQDVIRKIPAIRTIYNKNHGGVDHHHQQAVEFAPKRKFKYTWKHKFWATHNSLLTNSYITIKHLLDFEIDPTSFLLNIINSIRTKKPKARNLHLPLPPASILLHPLESINNQGKQLLCKVCKKKTSKCCFQCPGSPSLHLGACELRFHNPHIQIVGNFE